MLSFKKESNTDYYLRDTPVENVFLNEYMPGAPGDYVKVYLFALMYAELELIMTNEDISRHLAMPVEDVLKAWSYWEKLGIIRKFYPDGRDHLRYDVEFLNLKSMLYSKKSHRKRDDSKEKIQGLLSNEALRTLYDEVEHIVGRPLAPREMERVSNLTTEFGIAPELIIFAWRQAEKKNKQDSIAYVESIVKGWREKNLHTVAAATAYLEENDNRFHLYKRVLKALGMTRNATEEERRIMDVWFDEFRFDIDTVLEACKKTSGISSPNINYVNSVLKSWHEGDRRTNGTAKSTSGKKKQQPDIAQIYENIRAKNEKEASERRSEVYRKVPEIKALDEKIHRGSMDLSKVMLSGAANADDKAKSIRAKIEQLQADRAFLLTENSFALNYTDVAYCCQNCKDTGILDDGRQCPCIYEKSL